MKKIATLLVLSMIITATTFAAGIKDNISHQVLHSFNQKFSHAKEITWSQAETYLKATFKINGDTFFAFYAQDGELIGVSRNLTTTQLPINLQVSLTGNFGTSYVSDLFEMAANDETTYYVTLENADQKVTLKSTGNSWTMYKKVKKN